MEPKPSQRGAVATLIVGALILFGTSVWLRADWLAVSDRDAFLATTAQPLEQIAGWMAEGRLGAWTALGAGKSEGALREILWDSPGQRLPNGAVLVWSAAAQYAGNGAAGFLARLNLACQFLTALCLAFAAWFTARRLSVSSLRALALGFVPVILCLFLPGPMSWHVVPVAPESLLAAVFAGAVCAHAAAQNRGKRAVGAIATRGILLAGGAFLEPSFALVAAGCLLSDLWSGTGKVRLLTVMTTLVPAGAGVAVLHAVGLKHPAVASEPGLTLLDASQPGFGAWLAASYGFLAVPALLLGLVLFLIALCVRLRKHSEPGLLEALGLVMVPFLVYAAWRGSAAPRATPCAAPWGILFIVPIALGPLALLPLSVSKWLGFQASSPDAGQAPWRTALLPVFCLGLALAYAGSECVRFTGMLSEPTRYPKLLAEAGLMYETTPGGSRQESGGEAIARYAEGVPLDESVNLVDWRLSRVSRDGYRLSILFRTKDSLDEDWLVGVRADVRDEHLHRLPVDRIGIGCDDWTFTPDPPTSTWPAQRYVLLAENVHAAPVPYTVHVFLFQRRWSGGQFEIVRLGQEVTLSIHNPADQRQPLFVRNPGFERWTSGMPREWAVESLYLERFAKPVSDCVPEGTYALQSGPGYHWTMYTQTVPVYGRLAGKALRARMQAQSHDGRVRLMFDFDGTRVFSPTHPGDGRWRTVELRCPPPQSFAADSVTVGLLHDGVPLCGCILDDVTLEAE